jgi:hypothetical protein
MVPDMYDKIIHKNNEGVTAAHECRVLPPLAEPIITNKFCTLMEAILKFSSHWR